MAKKTHKDIEYAVDDFSGKERIFKTFDEAAGFAVAVAASGKEDVSIDVLIYSKAAARAYGGDDFADEYAEDPDASVSDRIVITAESVGKVS